MDLAAWTVIIFLARMLDVSLGMLRVQFIVRRKKLMAGPTGFVGGLIFIMIVSRVIQDIQHFPSILAYAGGFAVGPLLGMHLSEKLSRQVVQSTVIPKARSPGVERAIRGARFALTRYDGAGRDGPVDVLDVVWSSRGVSQPVEAVTKVDPQAFMCTHELAGLRGGYVYGVKSKV